MSTEDKLREALDDCATHREAWLSAFDTLIEQAKNTEDGGTYFEHEKRALKRTLDALALPRVDHNAIWRDNVQSLYAALGMIREYVSEHGPVGAMPSEEETMEAPHLEAEAIIAGIDKWLAQSRPSLRPALVVHYYNKHSKGRRSAYYLEDDRFEALAFFISTGKALNSRAIAMQRVWVEQ